MNRRTIALLASSPACAPLGFAWTVKTGEGRRPSACGHPACAGAAIAMTPSEKISSGSKRFISRLHRMERTNDGAGLIGAGDSHLSQDGRTRKPLERRL